MMSFDAQKGEKERLSRAPFLTEKGKRRRGEKGGKKERAPVNNPRHRPAISSSPKNEKEKRPGTTSSPCQLTVPGKKKKKKEEKGGKKSAGPCAHYTIRGKSVQSKEKTGEEKKGPGFL